MNNNFRNDLTELKLLFVYIFLEMARYEIIYLTRNAETFDKIEMTSICHNFVFLGILMDFYHSV